MKKIYVQENLVDNQLHVIYMYMCSAKVFKETTRQRGKKSKICRFTNIENSPNPLIFYDFQPYKRIELFEDDAKFVFNALAEQTSSRTWKKRIKILLNQVISEIAYFVCSWGKCQSGRCQGVKRSKAEKEVYFMPITRFGKNVHPRVKFFESTSLNWQFLQFFFVQVVV